MASTSKISKYIIYFVSIPVLLAVATIGLGAFVGLGLYLKAFRDNENTLEGILVCCIFEIAWLSLFLFANQ